MKKRFGLRRTIALMLTLVLVTAHAVPVNAVQSAGGEDSPWYDSIAEMLEAGEYEEGVVIAGIDMSKAARSGDPVSALRTGDFSEEAEELIYVDTEDTSAEQAFFSWLKDLIGKIAGEQDDSICITSIRRSDMTTEQMLRLLASDDSIVFAEPNYTIFHYRVFLQYL